MRKKYEKKGFRPPPLGSVSSYLFVISCLRDSQTMEYIRLLFGVPKSTWSYHVRKLKVLDVIRRVSYGVWEVNNANVQRVYDVKKRAFSSAKEVRTLGLGRSNLTGGRVGEKFVLVGGERVVQDSVAAHGLMFTFSLPSLCRWSKSGRRTYLESRSIGFRVLRYGESLDVSLTLGWKVHLYDRSLVLYAPVGKRWYAADAGRAYSEGLFEALRVVKKVEQLLGVGLSWSGRYKFKTVREHHALIGNALAEQYTQAGEKLYLRDVRGLWGLIDASVDRGEFETVRPGVDGRSANERVQDCFNEVKDTGFSPKDTLAIVHGLAENAQVFGEHMKTHVEVMMEIRRLIAGFNKK